MSKAENNITIEKSKVDIYKIRHKGSCVWGDITVEFGKTSAQLMINSDYGSYAYNWFSTGENPKKFLCDINMCYAMEKLSDYNLYEPDPYKYSDEIKELIIDSRKGEYLTKEEAREAWDDMLGILDDYPSGDIMYKELIDHKYFNKVFGGFEYLPSATRVKPKHKHFWENIWLPFVDELKRELSKETGEK